MLVIGSLTRFGKIWPVGPLNVNNLRPLETEKEQDKAPSKRSRTPSLAETEEALAQAVWCWAGIAMWVLDIHTF